MLCLLANTSYAAHADIVAIGASHLQGYNSTDPLPALATYLSLSTTSNHAQASTCSATGVSELSGWLSTYTPDRLYSDYGANDIICPLVGGCGAPCPVAHSMSTWLNTDLPYFLSTATTAGTSFYLVPFNPIVSYQGHDLSNSFKIWTAWGAKWAKDNNVPVANNFLEMSDLTVADDISSAYDLGDHLHYNNAGSAVYSYLLYHSGVPTDSWDFGSSSYPDYPHQSFSFWKITGGSLVGGDTDSVTGHKKGGTLTLGSSDSAVSPVMAYVPSNGKISFTTTGTTGTKYYRQSASNFTSTAVSPSWVEYTGVVDPISAGTAEFMQFKIVGTTAATFVSMNWNVDTTAPETTISTSSPQGISTDSLTVTGTASDDTAVSGCKFRMSSEPDATHGTACTGTTSFSCATSGYSSGANTLYVECYDAAGNYDSGNSITVNYTPPTQVSYSGSTHTGGTVR